MSRGVCMSRHVIFSFVYHTFSFFSYFLSPGLPSAAGQISWFRPNYGCARSLTDERLHYNMLLYNNISTRVLYSIYLYTVYYVYCGDIPVDRLFHITSQTHVRRVVGGGKSNAAGEPSNYRPPRTLRAGVCVYRPRRDIINLIRRVYITQVNRAWR